MSETPLSNRPDKVPYHKERRRYDTKRRNGSILVVVISVLLFTSGFTVFALITMIERDAPEKRSVLFPFDREVVVSLPSSEDLHSVVESAANENRSKGVFAEVVIEDKKRPLFINEMLDGTEKRLPVNIANRIDGFSIGSLEGEPFLLISFNTDAYSLMSEQQEDILRSASHFTGKTGGREIGRIKRANTLITLMEEGLLYGYLNSKTIAITANTDTFISIVNKYRSL